MSDTTIGFFNTPLAASPLVMGLLGLSNGMAQAGMPSRMPVPLGAAIGMGAGGLAQGMHAAQQGQMAQQQIQQAKLNNALAQARLPLFQQGINNLLAQQQGGASGGPAGVVPGALGGPAAGSGPSGGSHPYVSGPQLYNTANMMALLGQDSAARSVFNLYGSTGGGTGYTYDQNGNVMPLPGGPADPRTIGRNAAVKAYAAVPAAVQEAIAKLPIEQQQAAYEAQLKLNQSYAAPHDFGNGVVGPMPGPVPNVPPPPGYQPTGMQGAPAAAGFPGVVGALGSISDPGTRSAVIGAALKSGLPPAAWAPWIATLQNESGVNLQAANGTSGEIGVGQVMPATGQTLGYTPDQLRDPQTNLLASARYFGQKWQQAHGDPRGAFAGYNTGSVSGDAPAYTAVGMQRLASYGYPGAGERSAAGGRSAAGAPIVGASNPPAAGAPPAATPAAANVTTIQPGVTRTIGPGGTVSVVSTRPQMDQQFKADTEELHSIDGELATAQQQQARLLHMRDLLTHLPTGSGGETRAAMSNFIATYMPQFLSRWGETVNLPPAAQAQEFNKLALLGAGEQERQTLGGRGSMAAIEMYQRANPSLALQPTANRDIINMQIIAHQADVDYAQAEQKFVTDHQAIYTANQGAYVPSTQFDRTWRAQHNPQVYAGAMAAINGKPFAAWSKGLTAEEQSRVLQTVWRADPTASVFDPSGKPRYNGQLAQQAAR